MGLPATKSPGSELTMQLQTTPVSHTALDIDDEVEHRRLRCLGHIINLAAKSFFFSANSDIFEKEIDRAQLEEEQVERNLWRKRGPVGKLHNVVQYIRDSPQRREEF